MEYDPLAYWNARKNPNKSDRAPDWLLDHVGQFLNGTTRVFELGPGIGRTFSVYSSGQRIVTLDLSRSYAEALTTLAEKQGLSLSQHFLDRPDAAFPFRDGEFEIGACIQVLMHVPRNMIAHTMRELARVCSRTMVIAGLDPKWNNDATHCFNHDYLRICSEIGCVADEAVIRRDNICFILRRSERGRKGQDGASVDVRVKMGRAWT
jgi:2-polyprenyl-3-methyl-5-hydroxy-6-metoxy-1,4-benzoquinol methylase